MTTIRRLSEQSQNYIRTAKEMILSYQQLEKELGQQLRDDVIGRQGVYDKLNERKDKIESFLTSEGQELERLIDETRKFEKSIIKDTEEPVTTDMVAELDLLEKTIKQGDDISEYVSKYKNVPLAKKRLKNIATQNMIVYEDRKTKAEQLDTMLNNIKSHVEYTSAPRYDSPSVEWVLDNTVEHIERDLETYTNL